MSSTSPFLGKAKGVAADTIELTPPPFLELWSMNVNPWEVGDDERYTITDADADEDVSVDGEYPII